MKAHNILTVLYVKHNTTEVFTVKNTVTIETQSTSQQITADHLRRLIDVVNDNEITKSRFAGTSLGERIQEQLYDDYQALRRVNAILEERLGK